MTNITEVFRIHTPDEDCKLVPVPPAVLTETLAISSESGLQEAKIKEIIQEYVFYAIHRVTIEHVEDSSVQIRLDKETRWTLKVGGGHLELHVTLDVSKLSPDAGIQALRDQAHATLVYPADMAASKAAYLDNKRQRVFMGTGPKRERELLVRENLFAQIKPDSWDQVATQNGHLAIPKYDEIANMADITPIYRAKILGSGNLFGSEDFGSQMYDPIEVSVTFSSGVRLEREEHTSFSSVFKQIDGGDSDSDSDSGVKRVFDAAAYSALFQRRLAPVFKHLLQGQFWIPPLGLGIYAEAVPKEDKDELFGAWIKGITDAATEVGLPHTQLFLPDWAQFGSKSLHSQWQASGLQICGHAGEFAQAHGGSAVIVVCGDPVALPGNEAVLGMLKASGDPFSFSYLAYLPTTATTKEDVKKCPHGVYHSWCKEMLDELETEASPSASKRPRTDGHE